MRPILFLTAFTAFFVTCEYKSSTIKFSDITVYDTTAIPKDSLAFYFPVMSDNPELERFRQNWYSSNLYCLKEPILSKGYIGHRVYRFLWLRSFHKPVVFSLNYDSSKVWLVVKRLDQEPQIEDIRVKETSYQRKAHYLQNGYIVDKRDSNLLILKADRKANIDYAAQSYLTTTKLRKFELLMEKVEFWDIPSTIDKGGFDGSRWIIEAHLPTKYHYVVRWSPKDNFKELGLFLINLSDLKEKVY